MQEHEHAPTFTEEKYHHNMYSTRTT